jgi:hypothetical protein
LTPMRVATRARSAASRYTPRSTSMRCSSSAAANAA